MVGVIVLYNVILQMGEISPKSGPEPNWFLMHRNWVSDCFFLFNQPTECSLQVTLQSPNPSPQLFAVLVCRV